MMYTYNVQKECEIQSKPYSLCTLNLRPNHQLVISKAPFSKMIYLFHLNFVHINIQSFSLVLINCTIGVLQILQHNGYKTDLSQIIKKVILIYIN